MMCSIRKEKIDNCCMFHTRYVASQFVVFLDSVFSGFKEHSDV